MVLGALPWIAATVYRREDKGMRYGDDGFYYDLFRLPDRTATRLNVRFIAGPVSLRAPTVIEKRQRDQDP